MVPTSTSSSKMNQQHWSGKVVVHKASSSKTKKTIATTAKTKTKARVQRYLKRIEPQVREGIKSCLMLRGGGKCPLALRQVMMEMEKMRAPHSTKTLQKNNPTIVPFDSGDGSKSSLEFLMTKNDCSLAIVANSNKKRPNNLVLVRTFDRQILDMIELGILRFKSSFKDYNNNNNTDAVDAGGVVVPKKRIGSKPLLLFCGDVWQQDDTMRRLQNMLIDFYRGLVVEKLAAWNGGLDHLIMFTAAAAPATTTTTSSSSSPYLIHQRTYFMKLLKNNNNNKNSKQDSTSSPIPMLIPCGPDLDMQVRRTQFPSVDLHKASLRQPSSSSNKARRINNNNKTSQKNVSTNVFGEHVGRLHLTKQDVTKMGGRKAKALRIAGKEEALQEKQAVEEELHREQEQEQPYNDDDDDDE